MSLERRESEKEEEEERGGGRERAFHSRVGNQAVASGIDGRRHYVRSFRIFDGFSCAPLGSKRQREVDGWVSGYRFRICTSGGGR